MVDGISGYQNNGNINELQTGQLQQNQQVERVNRESAGAQKSGVTNLSDHAEISDAARARLEAEKEASRYASMAARMDEPFDADKVSYFKSLLDSGKINDYLRGLNNEDLADTLLKGPLGASLG